MRNMVTYFNKLHQMYPKRQFDAASKEDLKIYKHFLETRSWGTTGCPFECEWPWLTVPDMIAHKVAESVVAKV